MELPNDVKEACAPLFEVLPLERSMPQLVGSAPRHAELVEDALRNPALADRPELAAALWLYVDDLDRSHTISQGIHSATGSLWHGIMHRREGDFSNSLYWMRRAESHPLFGKLNPARLVNDVSRAGGQDSNDLVDRQRQEWLALFTWCANSAD
jgi:hypothetical protein